MYEPTEARGMPAAIHNFIRRAASAVSTFFRGPPAAPIPDFRLELKRVIEQHAGQDGAAWKGCIIGVCNLDDLNAADALRMAIRDKTKLPPANSAFDITKDLLCIYLVWRCPQTDPQSQPTAFRIESISPYDLNCNKTVDAMERVSDIDPSWYATPTINIQIVGSEALGKGG
jgi:hypothetical protein